MALPHSTIPAMIAAIPADLLNVMNPPEIEPPSETGRHVAAGH
jgi:hypothetical protein